MKERMSMTIEPRRMTGPGRLDVMHPGPEDAEAFGALLLDAYRGTVDDDGEDLDDAVAQARKALDGSWSTPNPEASFSVVEGGRMKAITLVVDFERTSLLAFAATEKASQGQGLATELIARSLDALARQGSTLMRLHVTVANAPAVRLYEELGFVREDTDD